MRSSSRLQSAYLQLAERRLDPGANEQVRRFLALAIQEARRQSSLVTELMDATRLHSGKLELGLAPLDLAPLVMQTVETAEVLTTGQTIALSAPTEPVMILGDTSRLEQVLLNLLTNAITHAPGTGRIDVRVQSDDGMAEVIVQDAGPGIPTEALETIFGRFAQVNPKERAGRAGLGLGLYIAREITEAHGGTITAHSEPGKGATFTVRLPFLAVAEDES